MAPREQDIDHICTGCGLVTQGPHKGEHADVQAVNTRLHTYKGAPISHATCDDCAEKNLAPARERAKRRGLRLEQTQAEETMPSTTRHQRSQRRYATWDELMADIRKKPGDKT